MIVFDAVICERIADMPVPRNAEARDPQMAMCNECGNLVWVSAPSRAVMATGAKPLCVRCLLLNHAPGHDVNVSDAQWAMARGILQRYITPEEFAQRFKRAQTGQT